MVGDAIESILSGIANITGGTVPRNKGAEWIVYNIISVVPHNTKSGVSTYDQYRVQIDCHSRSYAKAGTLAASVRSALDGYSGTAAGVVVDNVFYDGENDAVESVEELESREDFFRRSHDYIIFVK